MTTRRLLAELRATPHLEVERADYMYSDGRTAELTLGPFRFGVCTADGWSIGFSLVFGRMQWTWAVYHEQTP